MPSPEELDRTTPVDPATWQRTLDQVAQHFLEEDRVRRQQAAELPFSSIEANSTWAADFASLKKFAAGFQGEYEVVPHTIAAESVHVLGADNMRQALRLLNLKEDDGATYDPGHDIVYLPEPEQDSFGGVRHNYALAHELGHKLTPGLNTRHISHLMREGVADLFARQFMQTVYIPSRCPEVAGKIATAFYGGRRPYGIPGALLEPEEVLYIDPFTLHATEFTRFIETRIVKLVKRQLGEEGFTEYMRLAMNEDPDMPFQFLKEKLGIDMVSFLFINPDQVAPHIILRELRAVSK